jgi:hypothetical protein
MKRDLLDVLDRESKKWMESVRERELGYPKTWRRIEKFIATLPLARRESVRRMLLPESVQ